MILLNSFTGDYVETAVEDRLTTLSPIKNTSEFHSYNTILDHSRLSIIEILIQDINQCLIKIVFLPLMMKFIIIQRNILF